MKINGSVLKLMQVLPYPFKEPCFCLPAKLHLRLIAFSVAHIYWASGVPEETHGHGYI